MTLLQIILFLCLPSNKATKMKLKELFFKGTEFLIYLMLYPSKEEIHSEIVNYLLTEVVQSNEYYKSRAVGVTSKVSLTTDQDQETGHLLFLWNTGSHMVRDTI